MRKEISEKKVTKPEQSKVTQITRFFNKQEKNTPENPVITRNVARTSSPVRKTQKPVQYKQSSSHKKRKKLLEEKKVVTQNRGFWIKFAENQKRKETKITQTQARIDKSDQATSSKVSEKADCLGYMTAKSCTIVSSENKVVLESSTIPGNTGLKMKVKSNEKKTLGVQLGLSD